MTREQIKSYLELFKAYSEGKEIEMIVPDEKGWKWVPAKELHLNDLGSYRIKPELKSCSNCVFSVDNKHCGLPGFISEERYPHNNCPAWNNEKPKGFELQNNGYFSWVKEVKPKYRPYANSEEFLKAQKEHGPYLKMGSGFYVNILHINDLKINYVAHGGVSLYSPEYLSYSELPDYFTWQDGTPCGIIEES